jgi:hypothetical protein
MTIQQTLLSSSASSFNNWQANSVIASSVGPAGPNYITTARDNIYVSSDVYNPAISGVLTKYNKLGAITFQKNISNISNIRKLAIDSSDNIYIAGNYAIGGNNYVAVAKLNSSGIVQWTKQIGTINNALFLVSAAVDSLNNVYVTIIKNSVNGAIFAKFDTNGTIQFQKQLAGSGGNSITCLDMAIDSSDNIYIAGYSAPGTSADRVGALFKYDTSGTLQWQKYLRVPTPAYILFNFVNVDYDGNIYVIAQTDYSTASGNLVIIRFDVSGNMIFKYYVLNMPYNSTDATLSFDISNNIYINSTKNILKIDGNADRKWGITQTVNGGATPNVVAGVFANKTKNMVLTGQPQQASLNQILTVSLPNDGSKLGTFSIGGNAITYASASFFLNNVTITTTTATMVETTATETISTVTTTTADITYTQYFANI